MILFDPKQKFSQRLSVIRPGAFFKGHAGQATPDSGLGGGITCLDDDLPHAMQSEKQRDTIQSQTRSQSKTEHHQTLVHSSRAAPGKQPQIAGWAVESLASIMNCIQCNPRAIVTPFKARCQPKAELHPKFLSSSLARASDRNKEITASMMNCVQCTLRSSVIPFDPKRDVRHSEVLCPNSSIVTWSPIKPIEMPAQCLHFFFRWL